MRHLTHFSLRRNCTDHIIQVLSKASPFTLQSLDVENSRDVTDNGVQYICMFRVSCWEPKIHSHNKIHHILAERLEHLQLQHLSPGLGGHRADESRAEGAEEGSVPVWRARLPSTHQWSHLDHAEEIKASSFSSKSNFSCFVYQGIDF